MIQNARVKFLNSNHIQDGKYILYWMQSAQRTEFNHALEYSIDQANRLEKPLLVYFGIASEFPEATERSYYFMLQGLYDVSKKLTDRGIAYRFEIESPATGMKRLSENAVMIVVDRAYQKLQRSWRKDVSETVKCPVVQIETNVVVPVETTYFKEAYSAGILAPKIHQHLDEFLTPVSERILEKSYLSPPEESIDLTNIADVLDRIKVNEDVKRIKEIEGGSEAGRLTLLRFIQTKLDTYPEDSNDPGKDNISHLSPYLHFGQISPLEVALAILESDSSGSEPFLEQLIVRRELSMNFVYYNGDYDSYKCLPEWAQITLQAHQHDKRDYVYSLADFEKAETHDPYWNAAQNEMVRTGRMHNYMRMYWGKKILEWCKTPKKAYEIALYLNNKYELDGRDPNGYAGIAWCFGKHDRAWSERSILGKVRYMNSRGLERKFDMDKYVKRVNTI